MRPLLWKEMRDLGPWLLAGLAATGAVWVLLLTRVWDTGFVSFWMAMMPLAAAMVAVGLGVGQVARERHARTLDFLLVRPVAAGTIVWSKFLAGTVVLACLLAGAVALCYAVPESKDTGLLTIRCQVTLVQLAVTLLPRFWFVYALAFFFSVLVDRAAKAAALAVVLGIAVLALASAMEELAPFSGFVYWLPYFERAYGLIAAAKSVRLSLTTGVVYAAGALLAGAAAAAMLKRSSERYLGNRGLAVAMMAVVAVAWASAQVAANRLPELAPARAWDLAQPDDADPADIVADGGRVAVVLGPHVQFLDAAEVTLPLWTTSPDWAPRAAMRNDTVFLVGRKKAVPVDDLEIAIVKPSGPTEAISLGPVREGYYVSTPIPVGGLVYLGVTRDRVCSVSAFDAASGREMASVVIDRPRPPAPVAEARTPPVRMVRRGSYLYAATPSFLTAIDIGTPGTPVVAAQVPVRPKLEFLYAFARPLAWQDATLLETRIFPETLTAYDLRDPAHPVAKAEFASYDTMRVAGSGHAFYRPWRDGLLEYRVAGGGLEAQRYLNGDAAVSAMAVAGDWVYALTAADKHYHRSVQAFRVTR
jgi:ABC-type transport system involved in multi-copper enzyme maturation permease subunit